jgi:hypothetical protein
VANDGDGGSIIEFDHPSEAPKVDVCHRTGNGEFHLITVSANALEAHLRHGDALAGTPVPDLENVEFDESCEAVSTKVVEGSFSGSGLDIQFTAYLAFDDTVSGMGSYTYAVGDRSMDVAVLDVCLDPDAGTATVLGFGDPSWVTGEGYMVLTLVDTGGGTMATRALLFDAADEVGARSAFVSQCATGTTGATGGTGFLIFL